MRSSSSIRLPGLTKGKHPVFGRKQSGAPPFRQRMGSASWNQPSSAQLETSSVQEPCLRGSAWASPPGTTNTPLVSLLIKVLVLSGSCLFCPPAVTCLCRMLSPAGAAHTASAGKASSRAGCCFRGTLTATAACQGAGLMIPGSYQKVWEHSSERRREKEKTHLLVLTVPVCSYIQQL